MKSPAMKRPASSMKKPVMVMFRISPKRGTALRAMRRPTSRDKSYTTSGRMCVRRDHQATYGTDSGVKVEAHYKVMNDLIRLGIMPFKAVCSITVTVARRR
eukprot:19376-Amphidinium_carterae.1